MHDTIEATEAPHFADQVLAGNLILRAGRLPSGAPRLITPEQGGAIVFEMGDGSECLRFTPDGAVYVRGELVESNAKAWAHLREWLHHARVLSGGANA